ncbi:hypothetical protein PI95_034320 [Hassallia byssoidea VB512170]|uniref:Lipoprotein n=1 Tax=Hassallia byssoidea VB512170 TaxID=1304833 RepID=A0A846HJ54_9CYAN|nr:hypothetical protein [Hassalia byssoidea]NEU77406.1 hypothetical protein [Hassalia byssoidea VB512170]
MAKIFNILGLIVFLASCGTTISTFPTSDADKMGVKSNRFRGTAFSRSYRTHNLLVDTLNRFTPTQEDIALAEWILRHEIGKANKARINQFGQYPFIDRSLHKYFRQYIGVFAPNGDLIIEVNLHWDRVTLFDRVRGHWDGRLDYSSDYSVTLDGGSRYWQVGVNLTTRTLSGLSINGVAARKTAYNIGYPSLRATNRN